MKKLLTSLFFLFTISLAAQENAKDWILPQVQATKVLNHQSSNKLDGDITTQLLNSLKSEKFSYNAMVDSDNSSRYKIITHLPGSSYANPSHAYFVKFNGSSATLNGYSKYVVDYDDDDWFGDYDFVVNETYKDVESQTIYRVPTESYQTMEWTFTDPHTNKSVQAMSSYKTMKVYGYDRKILIIEFKSDGKTRKEYYMKFYGLIAVQNTKYELYINNFKNYKYYTKSFIDSKTEKELRNEYWSIYKRFSKLKLNDSSLSYKNNFYTLKDKHYDTIIGLMEHMIMKNREMANVYTYFISATHFDMATNIFNAAEKNQQTKSKGDLILRPTMNYFLVRPTVESIKKEGLNSHITNVNENFESNYWKMNSVFLKTILFNSDFDKTYKTSLCKQQIDYYIKNYSKIDNLNKCYNNSYIAYYYNLLGNKNKHYEYLVKYLEFFKFLSNTEKDLNIEYMRYVMKMLYTETPPDETILKDAMRILLDLKDYPNAIKVANNAIDKGVGSSIDFGFQFAEAAYKDEVNKIALKKAVGILNPQVNAMTPTQLTNYLPYCKAVAPDYDCSVAEREVEKAKKREEDKKKEEDKKRKKQSRGRPIGLTISSNPFNILWNTLPLVADIRIKKIYFQARYNQFNDRTSSNLWGNALAPSETKKKFEEINGADISGAIMKSVSYSRDVQTLVGVHVLFGDYTTKPERVYATNLTSGQRGYLDMSPNVKKTEVMFQLEQRVFMGRKNPLYFSFFYGLGVGRRTIDYNLSSIHNITKENIADKSKYEFDQDELSGGYDQDLWNKNYLVFRTGFRIGLRLF
jgi:hypothetical protein